MTKFITSGVALALVAAAQASTTYNDATGDLFDTAPSNLDISSV